MKVLIILFLLFTVSCKSPSNSDNNQNATDPNYDTNTLGIEWIDIPAGEFRMGDNFNEGSNDERPVHPVYLDAYKISTYEVTFAIYDKFCEETGRGRPDDKSMGRGNRPVINVSWNDANAFCNWLSQKTTKNIHLPTEAQWEKAARGTDQRRYPWGNSSPSCSKANYNGCGGTTKAVGSHPSGVSPYGVHDMAGNVWEWCFDWFSSVYYPTSPGNNPTGTSSGSGHTARGGGWFSDTWNIRSAVRFRINPTYRGSNLGFRLCQD
jgi:formylglycine-generating enzyme required for sulfatase activity